MSSNSRARDELSALGSRRNGGNKDEGICLVRGRVPMTKAKRNR